MIRTNIGKVLGLVCLAVGISLIGVGCKGDSESTKGPAAKQAGSEAGAKAEGGEKLTGSVKIDGSSTVYPISEAVAEEFRTVQPDVRPIVGISGTGGGMKKFIAG
ncbi:MAG: phosphate-binding protein, partial [Planctomycetaceae bacterium]|nr:phosphate-binding protein [Planctomycetaceae bacterium]